MLNLFLPLLGLTLLLAFSDLTKGGLKKSTLDLLTSLATVLGISLIVLVGLFFALIEKEVRLGVLLGVWRAKTYLETISNSL